VCVCACVWNILTDVKCLLVCLFNHAGEWSRPAELHLTKFPAVSWGYHCWHPVTYLHSCDHLLFRACFRLHLFICNQPVCMANRTDVYLHVCRNPVWDIHLLRFGLDDAWCLPGIYLFSIWGLFGNVSGRGLDFRNYILLVTYYLLEIYFASTILFNCTFWDSVPNGSLQYTTMIQLLSSVISLVIPTWCHGPNWGNLA